MDFSNWRETGGPNYTPYEFRRGQPLTQNGHISNHDEIPEAEEELFPTLRNVVILIWLRIIQKDLAIVQQRCCTNISNVSNPGINLTKNHTIAQQSRR